MSVIGWSLMRFGEDLHFFPVELIRIKLRKPQSMSVKGVYADELIPVVLGKVWRGGRRGKEGWERKEELKWWRFSSLFSVLLKCRLDTCCLN